MIKSLAVDIEGGWGGSSRSLFELISRLDQRRISPCIAHRQIGPIADRYKEIGIQTLHVPGIFSYVPRREKSFRNLVVHLPRLRQMAAAQSQIAALSHQHGAEILHLNYEGLSFMGPGLRRRLRIPIIMHCRTLLPQSGWGRMMVRAMKRSSDFIFFITTAEEERFRSLESGTRHPGAVLWNIASRLPRGPLHDPPEAIYVGNLDHSKGTDRLADIALALDEIGAPPLTIAVYGKGRSNSRVDERLREVANVIPERLSVRGHTATPEQEVARALAVVRPSRWNDPWGRDVIEAGVMGTPVLATGSYEGVVKNGETGFLFPEFDAMAFARTLVRLAQDDAHWRQVSGAALASSTKFLGHEQVALYTETCQQLVSRAKA